MADELVSQIQGFELMTSFRSFGGASDMRWAFPAPTRETEVASLTGRPTTASRRRRVGKSSGLTMGAITHPSDSHPMRDHEAGRNEFVLQFLDFEAT